MTGPVVDSCSCDPHKVPRTTGYLDFCSKCGGLKMMKVTVATAGRPPHDESWDRRLIGPADSCTVWPSAG